LKFLGWICHNSHSTNFCWSFTRFIVNQTKDW